MSLIPRFNVRTDVCGLDIGPVFLRAAQLNVPKQHSRLETVSEAAYGKKMLDKNTIIDTDVFGETLDNVLRNAQPRPITAKAIVAALPESSIFSRTITLPHLTPAELRKAVPFEIGQYLPVPIEEVYYDYTPLAVNTEKNQLDAALFAAPRSLVDPLIEIIHSRGLELYALETKSTAITRALIPNGSLDAVLIIEIGNHTTRFTILDHGDIWVSTSINNGSSQIHEAVTDKLGKAPAATPENREIISKIIEDAVKPIAAEAQSVTRYHETRDYKPSKIQKAILAGQGANLLNITASMHDALHIPCELAAPLITNSNPIDLRYSVAIGLSMRAL